MTLLQMQHSVPATINVAGTDSNGKEATYSVDVGIVGAAGRTHQGHVRK